MQRPPCRRAACGLVVVLALTFVVACGGDGDGPSPGLTPQERALQDFALAQFAQARTVLDPTDLAAPVTRFRPNHVEVASDRWRLTFDLSGRRIIGPVASYPHLAATLDEELGSDLDAWLGLSVSSDLVDEARELARLAFGATLPSDPAYVPFAVREVLRTRTAALPDQEGFHRGRTTVLFAAAEEPTSAFSTVVVFGRDETPLRIETAETTPDVASAAHDYRAAAAAGAIRGTRRYDTDLRFGTFFDGTGFRFELAAWSYEGERFLTTTEPATNPYGPYTPSGTCWELEMPMDWYRTTEEFRFWTWYWWDLNGRHGGVRGSWDVAANAWQVDQVTVAHHANLGDYALSGGSPEEPHDAVYCGTEHRSFQSSTGNQLEQQFYVDLEGCHVAAFQTHGGPLPRPGDGRQPFQMRHHLDYWFTLHLPGQPALGVGNLRFLLFGTCASMNWFKEAPGAGGGLEGDWMDFAVADGLRLACGHDGGYGSADREGWYFFSYYNVGDSVTDAWHRSSMQYDATNHPVSVAYAATLPQALATLYDDRFTKAPAGTGAIVAMESFVVGVDD